MIWLNFTCVLLFLCRTWICDHPAQVYCIVTGHDWQAPERGAGGVALQTGGGIPGRELLSHMLFFFILLAWGFLPFSGSLCIGLTEELDKTGFVPDLSLREASKICCFSFTDALTWHLPWQYIMYKTWKFCLFFCKCLDLWCSSGQHS